MPDGAAGATDGPDALHRLQDVGKNMESIGIRIQFINRSGRTC
jgi:hypothetical protein